MSSSNPKKRGNGDRNIRLTVEYDGSSYHGWQSQTNAVTVQSVLRDAIRKLTDEDVTIVGAGRTDAGVHALAQTANFLTSSRIPAERFSAALNSVLPCDIVVKSSCEAAPGFNARYSAVLKSYRYLIFNSSYPSAILRDRAWHCACQLDVAAMDKAARYLIGTHDFTSFMASGSKVKHTVRALSESHVSSDNAFMRGQEVLVYETSGNGYLYNMVRIIVGTLVDVGRGKLPPEDIVAIMHAKDRRKAGKTAPPHGLYLSWVYYGD